ncbi:MAG: OmpA family protein [Gammaproteobacteria bacterium]|nr:OmpA family protein [Gammaproteobacteria bacterium]
MLATIGAIYVLLWMAQVLLPVPPVPELTVRSGSGEVHLEWTLGAEDFDGRFEYQQRRLADADYSDVWIPMRGPRRHAVPDLVNGLLYFFRVRAVGPEEVAGAPSNEVGVVPLGLAEALGRLSERVAAIEGRVTAPDEVRFCAGEVVGEVGFDHDSASILPPANADLAAGNQARLAGVIRRLHGTDTEWVVQVTGYASTRGRASYNLDLSEARAEAVIEYLVQSSGALTGEFVAMAAGEGREWGEGKQEDEERRAVLVLCTSED